MKKLKSLPTLNRKLWSIFSEYIRRKEADDNGYVRCISCGVGKHWKEIHAGHYIPKSVSLALRFHPRNVHPQCAGCNTFRHGNISQYALALQKMYGKDVLEELDSIRHSVSRFSRTDYEEMIKEYQGKLEDLDAGEIFGAR